MENQGQTKTFFTPTGYQFVIREQNGADDDILSNSSDARTLMNLSKFVAAIVVSTDMTTSGKLTIEEAHAMPALDRYCILFQSRIHSLGENIEFDHDWGNDAGGTFRYEQSLLEYIFDDYSNAPSNEELAAKENAIPYYPNGKVTKDIEINLSSGKVVVFDLLTAEGEAMIMNLPPDKQTKNKDLESRNTRLKEGDGRLTKITNWSFFTSREMIELRKKVAGLDPVFKGILKVENPDFPGVFVNLNIVGIYDFFYPGEI